MKIERAVEMLKILRDKAVHELDKIARIRYQYEEQIKIGEPWYWKWEDSWHSLAAKHAEEEFESINTAIKSLERTRWIPVSDRLPTKEDANSKGKIIAWCTSFNGTEVDLNWRLIETDGVITHWRVGMEPPDVQSKENIDG